MLQFSVVAVLYAVDEGLGGNNVLQSVAIDWLILVSTCSSRSSPCSCHKVAMSLYNIKIAMQLPIVLNVLQVMSRAEGDREDEAETAL